MVVFGTADAAVLYQLKKGDTVQVDNSNFLAAQTYHRHQVPGEGYPTWDQFRDVDGHPIYPQRSMILGPMFAMGASGVLPNGSINGKVIALENLWDTEALPWQGDWYRQQVQKNLGDKTDDNFRLWYTDHASHGDYPFPGDPDYIVSYLGVLQQALLDLSAWVEKGIVPPASTSYKILDGQVVVPDAAEVRKGIQPLVHVKANGSERAEIQAGQSVNFTAVVEVPPHAGQIVDLEWDFEGSGEWEFPVQDQLKNGEVNGSTVTLKSTYTFTRPGTYFPVLRATSQREGDPDTPYTRIRNLGRVRVVVE